MWIFIDMIVSDGNAKIPSWQNIEDLLSVNTVIWL